jgi:hypothetical protein
MSMKTCHRKVLRPGLNRYAHWEAQSPDASIQALWEETIFEPSRYCSVYCVIVGMCTLKAILSPSVPPTMIVDIQDSIATVRIRTVWSAAIYGTRTMPVPGIVEESSGISRPQIKRTTATSRHFSTKCRGGINTSCTVNSMHC